MHTYQPTEAGHSRAAADRPTASSNLHPSTSAVNPNAPVQAMGWDDLAAGGLAGAGALGMLAGFPLYGAAGVVGGLGYLAAKNVMGSAGAAGPAVDRGTEEDMLSRAASRARKRKSSQRFETGRYDTATGPVTVSGLHRQRLAQTRRADYADETMGGIPPYSAMRHEMAEADIPHLYDPAHVPAPGMGMRRRMGVALATTASNVSENDKAPGMGKAIRAFARRRSDVGAAAPHPLDPAVNPAVRSAVDARAFMAGSTPLTGDQRAAIHDHFSDSSDSDDEHYALRTGLLLER